MSGKVKVRKSSRRNDTISSRIYRYCLEALQIATKRQIKDYRAFYSTTPLIENENEWKLFLFSSSFPYCFRNPVDFWGVAKKLNRIRVTRKVNRNIVLEWNIFVFYNLLLNKKYQIPALCWNRIFFQHFFWNKSLDTSKPF